MSFVNKGPTVWQLLLFGVAKLVVFADICQTNRQAQLHDFNGQTFGPSQIVGCVTQPCGSSILWLG